MNRCSRLLAAVALGGIVACERAPARLQVTTLAEGEWVVAGMTSRGALLQQTRGQQPRGERLAVPALPVFALADDTLRAQDVDTFSVLADTTHIVVARVGDGIFYTSAHGQPRFIPSPTDAQLFAVQLRDGIWVFKTPGEMHKLTLDYDRSELAKRQREGEVILYWSVNPIWSADGKFISFLTNRDAVRDHTQAQSAWQIDAYTGAQGPLFDSAGASVYVSGVLGDEFVLTNNQPPGIVAVHPRTRVARRLGDGYVLASHDFGRALLINNNGRVIILRGHDTDTLPVPDAGFVWSTQAAISPSGNNVAVYATDEAGVYVLHVFASGRALQPYRLPALPSSGPAWIKDDELIFTVQAPAGLQTHRARLR